MKENKEIKDIIAENLTRLRNESGMTQTELAAKLNYTDKSVSKWEHGDAMPPVDVLKEIADLYGVSLDYLTTENPEDYYPSDYYSSKTNNFNKKIITLLAVSLVWIIATTLYVYGLTLANKNYWIFFIFAVPLSVIVLIVFNSIWGKRSLNFILISALVWTSITTLYLYFLQNNIWAVFISGVPIQIAIILWSQLKRGRKNKK